MRGNRDAGTFDAELQLKDAGLIAASGIADVDGADAILDLGSAYFSGMLNVDISAIELATGDETYTLVLEFSNSASFASGIAQGPSLVLGDASGGAAMANATVDSVVGRHTLGFSNQLAGTIYRYVRLAVVVGGTVATGINFTAWVGRA